MNKKEEMLLAPSIDGIELTSEVSGDVPENIS
jgi:hypothetical protein